MLRLSFLLAGAALAAGTVGCTHCDTCDDFPVPCVGGNCGPSGVAMTTAGGTFGSPMPTVTPYASGMPAAPVAGPFAPAADVAVPAPAGDTPAPAATAPAPAPADTPVVLPEPKTPAPETPAPTGPASKPGD